MIYEWRIYEVLPGKMNVLHDRFKNVYIKLFEKHGIKVIGFWEAVVGTSNILYYMLAYESMSHREKAWGAYQSDPERTKARQQFEKEPPVVERVTNIFLSPTSYSPIK